MEKKHAVVQIHLGNGGTGLVVGRQVRQFVVGTEGLSRMACTHAARQIVFPLHDVLPDSIYGPQIGRVARKRRHVGHAGIHISGAHGMPPGFRLVHHRLVALRINVLDGGLAALVEEELGLVEILLRLRLQIL